jgi:hypothetical protein
MIPLITNNCKETVGRDTDSKWFIELSIGSYSIRGARSCRSNQCSHRGSGDDDAANEIIKSVSNKGSNSIW